MGAHKVVNGPHLGGQRAPDAGLARDWKRAAVRFACTRRGHRGDAIVRVGGNGQGAARVPSAVASPKRGTRTDIHATRGIRPVVILIVGILQVVVIVHARASLLAAARLARVVVVFVVVILPACTTWLVGLGTLVRRARADGRRAVEFVSRALLERGHGDGTKPPLRGDLARIALGCGATAAASRGALPQWVLRRWRLGLRRWLRRRRLRCRAIAIGRALRRCRGHRVPVCRRRQGLVVALVVVHGCACFLSDARACVWGVGLRSAR